MVTHIKNRPTKQIRNIRHNPRDGLEAWVKHTQRYIHESGVPDLRLPRGKNVSGVAIDRLLLIEGVVGLDNVWGAGFGWGASVKRHRTWKRRLQRRGLVPDDEKQIGSLVRLLMDPFLVQVPHPIIPPVYCLRDDRNFREWISELDGEFETAVRWDKDNQESIQSLINKVISGYDAQAVGYYCGIPGRTILEVALQFSPANQLILVKNKWASQSELYKLVLREYPDAIQEHTPEWLGTQRLDIYIPHLKVAIEYQGEQHFSPIGCFGGEDALTKSKERDVRKQSKCIENEVKLIYWNYNEPINQHTLKDKIRHIDYCLGSTRSCGERGKSSIDHALKTKQNVVGVWGFTCQFLRRLI